MVLQPPDTNPSIKPDPCRDAHNALRQNSQAQTAGGCTFICKTHVLTFALLLTPPAYSQACTPTEDTAPWPGQQWWWWGGTLPVHSYALSHEYKPSHVSRQISHCQWLILLRSGGLAYSSEPTQEPWGREAVPVSCWHSQGRVREPSPDPEQVALQLCPGWPCQLAHPLGQAWKAQGSLLGPRVRLPIGGGTSYWGMGQWKSCVRQAEALCMSMSLSSGSHLIHLGKDAGGPVTWFFNLNSLLNTPTPKGSWQLGLQFNNQMTQLAQ